MKDYECPVCAGEGYTLEPKDSDSMMRVECPLDCLMPIDTAELDEANELAEAMLKDGYDVDCQERHQEPLTEAEANAELVEELELLAQLQPFAFTADDLTTRAKRLLAFCHPNAVGGVFASASRRKKIKATGKWVRSRNPKANGRHIRVWQKS